MAQAAALLQKGDIVAFPTETVYGLGADATNEEAVRKIFSVKGRPQDNPLIVHIADLSLLEDVVLSVNARAQTLISAFWPGPLTLVLPRKASIPAFVSANLPTVAVRFPSHPVAQELILQSGLPIAAPSANLSGRPSPTTSGHVWEDFQGKIPLILDGGPCQVGLESTVVSVVGDKAVLLRPGGVTLEMLEETLGEKVEVSSGVLSALKPGERAASPGMLHKHYAPRAALTMVSGDDDFAKQTILRLAKEALLQNKKTAILTYNQTREAYLQTGALLYDLGDRENPGEVAKNLFAVLRTLDQDDCACAYLQDIPLQGMGLAVMNRALRSAGFHVIRQAL